MTSNINNNSSNSMEGPVRVLGLVYGETDESMELVTASGRLLVWRWFVKMTHDPEDPTYNKSSPVKRARCTLCTRYNSILDNNQYTYVIKY